MEEYKGCAYCMDDCCAPLDWKYGLDHILPEYKYCPMCGRELAEAAFAGYWARLSHNARRQIRREMRRMARRERRAGKSFLFDCALFCGAGAGLYAVVCAVLELT